MSFPVFTFTRTHIRLAKLPAAREEMQQNMPLSPLLRAPLTGDSGHGWGAAVAGRGPALRSPHLLFWLPGRKGSRARDRWLWGSALGRFCREGKGGPCMAWAPTVCPAARGVSTPRRQLCCPRESPLDSQVPPPRLGGARTLLRGSFWPRT